MKIAEVYNEYDPNFPDEIPDEKGGDPDDLSLPHEMRKLFSMRTTEY